jgi:predicted dehydrogenase
MYRPSQPPEYLDKPDANGYLAEIEYFVSALNQDSAPAIATMAEALDVLDIAMAVQESLTSGRVIQFDMKEE